MVRNRLTRDDDLGGGDDFLDGGGCVHDCVRGCGT